MKSKDIGMFRFPLLAWVLLSVFWLPLPAASADHNPLATRGVLDARQVDFMRQSVALNGEWAFYWHQLYTPTTLPLAGPATPAKVPGAWNGSPFQPTHFSSLGFATYHLRVLLPPSYPKRLALRLPIIHSAAQLWINGQLVLQAGRVARSSAGYQPAYAPGVISVEPTQPTLEIVLQVANFSHQQAGLRQAIDLGSESLIRQAYHRQLSQDFCLITMLLLVGFLGFFWVRPDYLPPIYFGFICLLAALRILVTWDCPITLFWEMPWEWMLRLEYLIFGLLIAAFALHINAVFPGLVPRWLLVGYCGVSLLLTLLVLGTSPHRFTSLIQPFYWVAAGMAGYALLLLIQACRKGLADSYTYLLGFSTVLLAFINDLLYGYNLIESANYLPAALFFFVILMAFVLSRDAVRTLQALREANQQLTLQTTQLMDTNALVEEQNQTLRELNEELDRFVYRTSHDLRAPIASVLGLIDIAQREQSIEQIKYYLTLQEKSLRKQDTVIGDIIHYARNRHSVLESEPIDFRQLLAEVFASHQYMEHADRLAQQVAWESQGVFTSDRKRLEVIFNNLVSNAVRYQNPYQQRPFLRIKVVSDAASARIEVSDNGLGIAPQYQARIFEMFFRGNNASSGSGVGLYLVKETVQKLGGQVEVASTVNEGTLFRIQLPSLALTAESNHPILTHST